MLRYNWPQILLCTIGTVTILHCNAQFCDVGTEIELAHHLDSDLGYFSPPMISTGNENEANNSLNTYSQIGVITSNDPTIFQDYYSYYTFRLKYITIETNSTQKLIWKQTSWITDYPTIKYTPINMPNRTNDWRIPFANFNGLTLCNNNPAYLCSVHSVLPNAWFNSVGTLSCNNCVSEFTPSEGASYTGGGDQPDGIICFDSLTCWFMQLHVCKPPTSAPTLVPTTSIPTTFTPTTMTPTTFIPTTSNPTTINPTNINPTTFIPTTANPTTINPTTINPTMMPTTVNPTTVDPTTSVPTIMDNDGEIDEASTTEIYMSEFDYKNDNVGNLNVFQNDVIIIVLIIVATIFICLIFVIIYCIYRKKQQKAQFHQHKDVIEAQSPRSETEVSHDNINKNTFQNNSTNVTNDSKLARVTVGGTMNNNNANDYEGDLDGIENVDETDDNHVTMGGMHSYDNEIELQDIVTANGEQDLEVTINNEESSHSVHGTTATGDGINESVNITTPGNMQEYDLNPNLQNDEFVVAGDDGDELIEYNQNITLQ